MLIYNEELGTEACVVNVDKSTSNFLIAFFGFYRHNILDNFNIFLKEVGIKTIISESKDYSKFKLDVNKSVEVYNCCDRRIFDTTLIVPKTFNNEKDALDWFNKKVKESEYIKKSEIIETGVIDGDKLLKVMSNCLTYEQKIKIVDIYFHQKIKELNIEMIEHFKDDPDFKLMIDEKFKNI